MEIVSLLEINRRLVEQGDLPSLLGEIVDAALKVTGAERGFLVLEEKGELRFDTAHDSRRGDIAQPDFEVSSSILNEALERMEPLRLSNAVDDPLLGHTPSVVSLELRSILCVPFRVDAGLAGAIYVDHRLRTGAFDDKAERLCALLADQAALAIRQIRRVEEIRSLNHRLERRVESQEVDLKAARAALESAGLAGSDSGLIGGSAVMERVRTLIDRAAKSGLVVLVTGESGTGKELAARALHFRSPRADGAFVSENCAALPPTLIESELFGYRRGAFTGAQDDAPGLVRSAAGGTLFLDEIGEMSGDAQPKLLRFLESGEILPLGETRPQLVDVRIVAATNADLEQLVTAGRFREDLFYRLNVIPIHIPPLRERREEIPALVEHFIERFGRELQKPMLRLADETLEYLLLYRWPGNVRQLSNEIRRIVALAEPGTAIMPAHLSADIVASRRTIPAKPTEIVMRIDQPLTAATEHLERAAIERAMAICDGRIDEAAKMLGLSRKGLYLKRHRLGLD
jgi:transcriptional regulator with GAF, ATPase, and Fis domain